MIPAVQMEVPQLTTISFTTSKAVAEHITLNDNVQSSGRGNDCILLVTLAA